jgi:hypothetical protein
VVKISPKWVRAQSRLSPMLGLLPLAFDNKLNKFFKIAGILIFK